MSYNDILAHIQNDEESTIAWKFRKITAHERPLKPNHPNYKGSTYNVMVEWENGEITSEKTLCIITADDPVTCAIYVKKITFLTRMVGKDSMALPSMRRRYSIWLTRPNFVLTTQHQNTSMVMRYPMTSSIQFRLMKSVVILSSRMLLSLSSNPKMRTFEDRGYKVDPQGATRKSMYT